MQIYTEQEVKNADGETKETTPNDSEEYPEYAEDDEEAILLQMKADPKSERNQISKYNYA